MNWENLAATLLASGTGTLIAASLTFLFALARFRREKAFDRRLQWYETAVRKLIDASDLLGRVVRAERVAQPFLCKRVRRWGCRPAQATAARASSRRSSLRRPPIGVDTWERLC